MKQAILLFTGVALTVLFLIFCSPIYESLYYSSEFSNEMYNSNMYFVIAVLTVLITWVVAGIYYYVINSVRFSRWYHWLIMLAAVTFCAPTVTYVYPNAEFTSQSYDYAVELMNFAVVNLAVTIVMFIIASFSIRWWSSQCRHTPIPQ